ncbi:hypothetical protein IF1G_07906 [Cordyceps javanica]|uniref:Uncharacterized protein n=1 Tax=Cordyceps javanica TaxID=43265 RepID=A0A545UV33_9HYPO|nr:hypothetical protein IF1G_07906 [Cordyceps javanica]
MLWDEQCRPRFNNLGYYYGDNVYLRGDNLYEILGILRDSRLGLRWCFKSDMPLYHSHLSRWTCVQTWPRIVQWRWNKDDVFTSCRDFQLQMGAGSNDTCFFVIAVAWNPVQGWPVWGAWVRPVPSGGEPSV